MTYDDLVRRLQAKHAEAPEDGKRELEHRVAAVHADLDEEHDAQLAQMQAAGTQAFIDPYIAANRDAARRLWPAVGYGAEPHVRMFDLLGADDHLKYDGEMSRIALLLASQLFQ